MFILISSFFNGIESKLIFLSLLNILSSLMLSSWFNISLMLILMSYFFNGIESKLTFLSILNISSNLMLWS